MSGARRRRGDGGVRAAARLPSAGHVHRVDGIGVRRASARAAVLVCLAVGAASALAAGVVLERVEVSGARATVVRLRLSAPAVVRSQALPPRAGQPDRILVDVVGATLSASARGVIGGRGALLRVIPDQIDAATVRLTLELTDPVPFGVASAGPLVTITLADDPASLAAPPAVPRVEQPAVR